MTRFENLSHYDYTNGSSDSSKSLDFSESSNISFDRALELLHRENKNHPPINYNVFTLAWLRNSREERRSAKPIVERKGGRVEKKRKEREERVERETLAEEGDENLEVCY